MSDDLFLWGVGGLVFLLTLGYVFLMFFFPEWVGLSGEVTRKTLESHQEKEPEKEKEEEPEKEVV